MASRQHRGQKVNVSQQKQGRGSQKIIAEVLETNGQYVRILTENGEEIEVLDTEID